MRIKKKNHICLLCKNPCYGLRYCSNCYTTKFQLGRIPWNKGKKTGLIPKTAFKKGIRFNPAGEFKKGHGKSFAGTVKEYKALHYWVGLQRGKANTYGCVFCQKQAEEWANISHKYKQDVNDWMPLCKKCHFKYDHNK